MTDGNFGASVESILLELASQAATGALTITGPDAEQSVVWFRDGLVYSVSVPGRRPLLGVRLMSSGSLTPESLAEALEVQRTELQGWRLGELLVHLGFVDRTVVEAFVLEQVHDQVADLLHWRVVAHRFRNGQRTRQDVAPPAEVTELLAEARERDERWAAIADTVGGADGVPVLSASENAASDVVLGPYDWALLCKVDGVRSIADLADDCGFTVYEAGIVVEGLIAAGLVEVEPLGYELEPVPCTEEDAVDVAASVAKVTAALTDMLGSTSTAPGSGRKSSPFGAPPTFAAAAEDGLAEVVSLQQERADRDAAVALREDEARKEQERRDAAAQEAAERAEEERLDEMALERAEREEADRVAAEEEADAAEHAAKETRRAEKAREREERARKAARAATEQRRQEKAEQEKVRLEAERLEEERLEAEAREKAEREEAERVAVEEAEAARLAAERAEAERIAAEEEAARLEAERVAAEEAARAEAERAAAEEEAYRLEAERLAAEEEAERAAAEQAEADRIAAEEEAARLEAERLAAEEEAARAEAERIAAEQAEADRIAAEEEAARLEAERVAAEEAARAEAERVETERIAAEDAARVEAERIAAGQAEAERIAAEEEAARLEAERLAAEEVERAEAAARLDALLAEPVPGLAPLDRPGFAALLSEFDRDSAAAAANPGPEPEPEPEPEVEAAEPDPEPAPALVGAPVEQPDTAALLRELSSLGGFGGMDTPPPASATPPRPAPRKPAPAEQPKKRGLFRR